MMTKRDNIFITTRNAKVGNPIKFRIHFDSDTGKHVLCYQTLFSWIHFSEEICLDMIKVLKEYNK